jgi:hypothetical protein
MLGTLRVPKGKPNCLPQLDQCSSNRCGEKSQGGAAVQKYQRQQKDDFHPGDEPGDKSLLPYFLYPITLLKMGDFYSNLKRASSSMPVVIAVIFTSNPFGNMSFNRSEL